VIKRFSIYYIQMTTIMALIMSSFYGLIIFLFLFVINGGT